MDPQPKITTTLAGMHGEGMQLELSWELDGDVNYFGSFVADPADDSLSLELTLHGRLIRISVAQLESLIVAAKEGVHSEGWYDKTAPSGNYS